MKTARLLFGLLVSGSSSAWADWQATGQGLFFYTDDVGIFSATRRLTRDGDPTQPALDSRLTGQGSDFVFEPQLEVGNSFDNALGKTTLGLQGGGFVYGENSRYNHGTLRLQAKQAITPETSLLLRYYYSPDLFLGDNEERRTGQGSMVGEQVTSHIGSARLSHELAEGLEVRLLARYGIRRYNQAFSERDTDFWTVGPHMDWRFLPKATIGLSYHFERGLADGRNQPQYEDDVSYDNHYVSADLDFELTERISLSLAIHYERNNWLSRLAGDERNGAHEDVYQGEAILAYRVTESIRTLLGVQHSSRQESFEPQAITNTNVGLGVAAKF
jgi:hypothetical protein